MIAVRSRFGSDRTGRGFAWLYEYDAGSMDALARDGGSSVFPRTLDSLFHAIFSYFYSRCCHNAYRYLLLTMLRVSKSCAIETALFKRISLPRNRARREHWVI
jgi:hypothetical protein